MNKRIRKKKQKQLEKCLLDLATAIDAGIQEYWRWRETMQRRYAQLYAEEFARRMGLNPETVTGIKGFAAWKQTLSYLSFIKEKDFKELMKHQKRKHGLHDTRPYRGDVPPKPYN